MNNHFPSLFDNNVLEKVDGNTALVEVARRRSKIVIPHSSLYKKIHISRNFRVHNLIM